MANSFFEQGAQRAERVKALFGRIARRYDLVNDIQSFGLHRRWKQRLIRMAQARPGERALDICCGTGDLAFGLAAEGLAVVGCDFSGEMLQVAHERQAVCEVRTRAQGRSPGGRATTALGPPQFMRADAQALPFPDNSFDIVTVGYGLRNLSDWQAGLREMCRVAAPGGRLLVLDFGKPENRFWRGLYFSYLRLVVPVFGIFFCGSASAYAYILESLNHYPAQRGVAEAMTALGLRNVRLVDLVAGAMSINYAEKPA